MQRRWLTLKRSVRNHEEMSHQGKSTYRVHLTSPLADTLIEIMDILRLKKSNMPPPPAHPRKLRVTSEATVPLDIQNGDSDMGFPAGPSSSGVGPSTQVLDMRQAMRPPAQEEQQEQAVMPIEQHLNDQDANESTSGSSSSSSESGEDSDDSSDSD